MSHTNGHHPHPSTPSLVLYASPRSPFARRIRLALDRLSSLIRVPVEEKLIDVFNPPEAFQTATPLGMIPTLVLTDGTVLSDSNNIMEWIHQRTRAIYPTGPLEWPVRQATVWIDGLIQAAVAYHQEVHTRPAPSELWTKDYYSTIEDTLLVLSRIQPEWLIENKSGLTQLGWDLAVALEYLDFRVPNCNWRGRYPQWLALIEHAKMSSKFVETAPPTSATT